MDADFIDIELRSPADVAKRCIILAALLRRFWLESWLLSTDSEDRGAEAFDLREWLKVEGIWSSLTTDEVDLFERPVGSVSEDQIAVGAWQAEGLATLGWALELAQHLPTGDLGDITAVVQAVPAPWDKSTEWLANARLRSESEIATERDRAEILDWRIAIEEPMRTSTGQAKADFAAAIADVMQEAHASGLFERDRGTDFSIGGRTLESLSDQDLERLSALAEERLRALNWLCGYGATWDSVPLNI